jgi:hypothetical protein
MVTPWHSEIEEKILQLRGSHMSVVRVMVFSRSCQSTALPGLETI